METNRKLCPICGEDLYSDFEFCIQVVETGEEICVECSIKQDEEE